MKAKLILLLLVLLTLHGATQAQQSNLLRRSPYTYIYKLNTKDAGAYYTSGDKAIGLQQLHTLVDSFEVYTAYEKQLPQGHYLLVHTLGPYLHYELRQERPYTLQLLQNGQSLQVLLHDASGRSITDAAIVYRKRSLQLDPQTQTYVQPKAKKAGLLEISYNGFTGYEQLQHKSIQTYTYNPFQNRSLITRVVYARPFYYLWKPFQDVVKTVHYGPHGWVRSVASVFSEEYRRSSYGDKMIGYIATDKPIYRPSDTLRYKAFVINRNGKPYRKLLSLVTQVNGKPKAVAQLKPYRPGAYSGELFLHDSLNLRLDTYAQLSLARPKELWEPLLSSSFKYEDYELKENAYSARLAQQSHYQGQQNTLILRGTDANGLNLLDVRVELTLRSGSVSEMQVPELFLPDTLWQHRQTLAQEGETHIPLPDSIFPAVSLNYSLTIAFLNSSNERTQKEVRGKYLHRQSRLQLQLQADSLYLRLLRGDSSLHVSGATLKAYNRQGRAVQESNLNLPTSVRVNPYVASYTLTARGIEEMLELHKEQGGFGLITERQPDSLYLAVQNPRQLPFWYSVFRGDKLVYSGQERAQLWERLLPAGGGKAYHVVAQYMWGGQIYTAGADAHYLKHRLNLQLDAPSVIYPGQKSAFTVTATDVKGKPVAGADLTAYAITAKFEEQREPSLPDFNKYRGRKSLQELESVKDTKFGKKPLDWTHWRERLQLDSLQFYKFSYPSGGLYTNYSLNPDSITSIAPFVVDSGRVQQVHVVYVDEVPIYFSGTDNLPTYAFPVFSGYRQVKLRTARHLISLDSVYLQPYHRLTLSTDVTRLQQKPEIKQELSKREHAHLNQFLFRVQAPQGSTSYLKQEDHIQVLPQLPAYYRYNTAAQQSLLVGPSLPSVMQYKRMGDFTVNFTPEPNYTLDFGPELLKMREALVLPPHIFLKDETIETEQVPINQSPIAEDHLLAAYQTEVRAQKLRKIYADNKYIAPDTHHGLLVLHLDTAFSQQPIHIALLPASEKALELASFYSGTTKQLNQVTAGKYKLVLLWPDGRYLARELQVKGAGKTWLYFPERARRDPDNFSTSVVQELERRIKKASEATLQTMQALGIKLQQNYDSFAFTHPVQGRVTGPEGEELPGVVVQVKGTDIGILTDSNGYYSLFAPANGTLQFKYIGFDMEEVQVMHSTRLDVVMNYSSNELQETVVVGYGVASEKRTTATMTLSNVLNGKAAGVKIRGTSTVQETKEPLILLNGVPYSGKLSDFTPEQLQNLRTLSGAEATALYGAAGAGGVILINNGAGAAEGALPMAKAAGSGLRSNFSDNAFWQPRLATDKAGKATFEVLFPDDVTTWNTYILGMDAKKRSGMLSHNTKAFKALMAALSVPRFMVEGDRAEVIGKAMNYLPDTAQVEAGFVVDGAPQRLRQVQLRRLYTDSLMLAAPAAATTDSVAVTFSLTQPNGFTDGERRHITIYPKGVEETQGAFLALAGDTTLRLTFDPGKGPVKLRVQGGLLQVMLEEIEHIHNYAYWCNEQAASKLKALLLEQKVRQQLGQPFWHEGDVRKLVRHLQKSQLQSGLWSWWQSGQPYLWISHHALESLVQARDAGYSTKVDTALVAQQLRYHLEKSNSYNKLSTLEILHTLGYAFDYKRHVLDLERAPNQALEYKLRLMRLRQLQHMPIELDSLLSLKRETMLGGAYWGEQKFSLYNSSVSNTLLAYQILRSAGGHERELRQIRNWLLQERRSGHWRNTYESARVLETLLPDLLEENKSVTATEVYLQGHKLPKLQQNAPLDTLLLPTKTLELQVHGQQPVYLSAHQSYWVQEPEPVTKDFTVKTSFASEAREAELQAGVPVTLQVEVQVKADADFVLIEVPIPAGCSYDEKENQQTSAWETHREYYRDKVSIFADHLPKGSYTYTIRLLPRYKGKYTLNPAKAELMYFPTFYGREKSKRIGIK